MYDKTQRKKKRKKKQKHKGFSKYVSLDRMVPAMAQ